MNESLSTTSKIYLRDLEAVEAPQEKYLRSLLALFFLLMEFLIINPS
jgi:hypothetical protein